MTRLLSRPAHTLSYERLQVAIHPCVINNRPHIVYPRGLQIEAPQLFEQLRNHYQRRGYALKEDQRGSKTSASHQNDRRHWAPALLFTASLFLEIPAQADTGNDHEHIDSRIDVAYSLVSNPAVSGVESLAISLARLQPAVATPSSELAAWINGILLQHYQRAESDPPHIESDLREMAQYYSQFPDVVSIFSELEGKKWQLVFDEKTWATVASGNAFRVDSAKVHFNTRSAARLKLNNQCEGNPVCTASPADALLHELLHAHSMLVNTEEFLAQGGMTRVLYAYKHEYAIIEKERKLYASMSRVDGTRRPLRTDHTGRLVKAQCVVCIQ